MKNKKFSSLFIKGKTRTGKTSYLVDEFSEWVRNKLKEQDSKRKKSPQDKLTSAILVFAANNQNRRELADLLSYSVEGTYPVICKTLMGFITDEVVLFWPLIFDELNLKAQFPIRLRPETEQEFATQLWREGNDWEHLIEMDGEYRFVRKTLDLLQLAGASGVKAEDIPLILESGIPEIEGETKNFTRMGELLLDWRKWCLERGFLSYGIMYELYWRYLLNNPKYQQHLIDRHEIIFADDIDDYPAIARNLFELLLRNSTKGVFTYNPDGQIRLGLNADPNYLAGLANICTVKELPFDRTSIDSVVELVMDTGYTNTVPNFIRSIQTISRADLLRTTANIVIELVKEKNVKPGDIALIAPGLDEIARYTLIEILKASNIPIAPINEQRSLISTPIVRALLTLMALVYPGIGQLVTSDGIAEMLTILSVKPGSGKLISEIDPVRGGLLADYCYQLCSQRNPEYPELLPVESFTRWDRLGHQTTNAYRKIAKWIEEIKIQQQKQLFPTPAILISKAIEHFFGKGELLSYEQHSALRELIETAQHFWEVDKRIRQSQPSLQTQAVTVEQFIKLLRRGTITANPRPNRQFIPSDGVIALSNIFQYRSLRTSHRWQFWLDSSSSFWEQGGASTLFAAPLFLKDWDGSPWTIEHQYQMDRHRLERIIRDLLARVSDRVIICHSDLSVNGTEQMGALFPLVQSSVQIN